MTTMETIKTLVNKFKSTKAFHDNNLDDPNRNGTLKLISSNVFLPNSLLKQGNPFTDVDISYRENSKYPTFRVYHSLFGISIQHYVDMNCPRTEFIIIGNNDQIKQALEYLLKSTTIITKDNILDFNKHPKITSNFLDDVLKTKELRFGHTFSIPISSSFNLPVGYNNILNGIFGLISQVPNLSNVRLVSCNKLRNSIDFVKY